VTARQEAVDCSKGGSNQIEMNACAARAAEASAAKLARLLKELEAKLDPAPRAELRRIQTQWQNLRDKDCEWERSTFAGGSAAPMVQGYCIAARTNERIDRLKIMLCEGGGMTGPCEASRKY
jgi:uncharacterized protein YecT (DUF1311 family)